MSLPSSKPTIAVLIDHVDYFFGGYATQVRSGLEEAAQRHGYWLNIFVGHELGGGPEELIHHYAGRDNADGMILLSAGLSAVGGPDSVRELISRHAGFPMCSLGVALSEIPSVVADNRPGLEEVIEHVIVDHGRRKLACLAGHLSNPDHFTRFDVFREMLKRHNIDFDPRLVIEGVVDTYAGRRAVQQLLDCGHDFDAVFACNDSSALGVLEGLNNAGLQVPRHISVVGFDDLPICRFTQPPLTTVRQPIRAMAALAVDIVSAQIAGHPVPLLSSLAVEGVRRASCGCLAALSHVYPLSAEEHGQDLPSWLARNESQLAETLCNRLGPHLDENRQWVMSLLQALRRELAGECGSFIEALEERMLHAKDPEREYESLLRVVAALRNTFSVVGRHLESLWTDAERSLAVATMVDQARQRVAIETAYLGLLESGAGLTRSLDWDSLRHNLAQALPALAESAFISLKTADSNDWLEPFLCMSNGVVHKSSLTKFPASQLIPPDAPSIPRQRSRMILPLTVEQEYLGLAAIELRPGLGIHEMLRSQISTALKSVSLHQQIVRQTAIHERGIQERLATSKRLESLGVLAGGVAHDLNNALGPLVALPNIILDELREVPMGHHESIIVSDLELLKGAALRAAQTIKDLLTLGRQGRMPKQPLNVARFCDNSMESDPALFEYASRHEVRFECILPDEELVITASEMQLQRAVSNLLRNAIDATPPGGYVRLRTFATSLAEPLDAYETIDPGQYVVIEVSDSGCGIAPDDLGRVFEPFFSNKQLSETSGTGLGLSIVHGVVKEHDGFASVESTLNRGTTFTLYFPRVTARVGSSRAAAPVQAGTGRILVVDDDRIQLRTASRVLNYYGYDVTTAMTSADALEAYRANTLAEGKPGGFDLVVLDMFLRESQDGLTLFTRLQQLGLATKGIVVSGNAPTQALSDAIGKGLHFLAKPYRAEELIQAIQAALEAPAPEPIEVACDEHHGPFC